MQRLNTRDLVNSAIFAVIYFVIMYAFGMVGFIGPAFMFVGWAVSIIINGIVVMLLWARVPKIGSVTILGLIVGLGMAPGHTIWIIPGAIALSFLADLITWYGAKDKRIRPARAISAYAVLQLWFLIPLIPILVDADAYYSEITTMMGEQYVATMRVIFSPTVIGIWGVCLLILGALGGLLGVRTARKHFSRAGLTSAQG